MVTYIKQTLPDVNPLAIFIQILFLFAILFDQLHYECLLPLIKSKVNSLNNLTFESLPGINRNVLLNGDFDLFALISRHVAVDVEILSL